MRANALQPIDCRRLWLGGMWPMFDRLRTSWKEQDGVMRGVGGSMKNSETFVRDDSKT